MFRAKVGPLGVLAALGLLITAEGCSIVAPEPEVQELRWLYGADANHVFRDDLQTNSLKFYVVYGYTKEILGVGLDQYDRCYNGMELVTIEGTSDAIVSFEHLQLNQLAREFSETYNTRVREHLDRVTEKACRQD